MVTEALDTDARLSSGASQLRRIHWRELFNGMGFAVAVTFVTITAWTVQVFFGRLAELGTTLALRQSLGASLGLMLNQLPVVPLLVACINLPTQTRLPRHVCYPAAMVAMYGWCVAIKWWKGLPLVSHATLPYVLLGALIIAACAYRGSTHTAGRAFMQGESAAAALDVELKRARLQLLRAQIEPHFLFNTLATVRTLMRTNRLAAGQMIDSLMRYLSEALPKLRQDESSLAEEVALIDAYLRIQQVRMGKRLSYELHIPDELGNRRIPTMMLLTLVENALKHGINPAVSGGAICVSANLKHAELVLKVADSGQGMAATQGHGMGLANIRQRLTMLYGEAARLTLARAESHGVVATIAIPLAAAS